MWVIKTAKDIGGRKSVYQVGYYEIVDQINREMREVVHYHLWVCFDVCEDKLEAIELCSKLNGGS